MKTVQDEKKLKEEAEFYERVEKTNEDYLDYWIDHTLFHWDFWISLAFTILPIIFWIRFRKKESTHRLLFVGFFVLIIASWLDFIGVQFGKWYYTGKVFPSIPSYLPWDWVLLPIFVMVLLQIKPKASPWLKAIIFGTVNAFIGEPLFLWLGFYQMKEWHIYYSLPIYMIIYLVAHALSKVGKFDHLT